MHGVDESEVSVLVEIEPDDGVMEVDPSGRRMSDTYIGVVVGILAVVILLIVVVSVVVGVRLRRKKYGGGGGGSGSPSKFVFATASLRRSDVDCSQTLPLGAVRFIVITSR